MKERAGLVTRSLFPAMLLPAPKAAAHRVRAAAGMTYAGNRSVGPVGDRPVGLPSGARMKPARRSPPSPSHAHSTDASGEPRSLWG